MGAGQFVLAFALAFGVAALSVFYAFRQLQVLRRLREHSDLPTEETRRERRQCWRRLVSSGLLLIMAVLIAAAQLWLESPADRFAKNRDASNLPLSETEVPFLRLYTGVWIAILLLLLIVIMLAAFDLWAIRRFGRLQHRKLRDDRRAMIARQLQRLRKERNGD